MRWRNPRSPSDAARSYGSWRPRPIGSRRTIETNPACGWPGSSERPRHRGPSRRDPVHRNRPAGATRARSSWPPECRRVRLHPAALSGVGWRHEIAIATSRRAAGRRDRAAAINCSLRSTVVSNGFSHSTCLPAANAASRDFKMGIGRGQNQDGIDPRIGDRRSDVIAGRESHSVPRRSAVAQGFGRPRARPGPDQPDPEIAFACGASALPRPMTARPIMSGAPRRNASHAPEHAAPCGRQRTPAPVAVRRNHACGPP